MGKKHISLILNYIREKYPEKKLLPITALHEAIYYTVGYSKSSATKHVRYLAKKGFIEHKHKGKRIKRQRFKLTDKDLKVSIRSSGEHPFADILSPIVEQMTPEQLEIRQISEDLSRMESDNPNGWALENRLNKLQSSNTMMIEYDEDNPSFPTRIYHLPNPNAKKESKKSMGSCWIA